MKLVRMISAGRAQLSALMFRLHAPQWVSLMLIAVTLACAAVMIWLIYNTALDKETAAWGKLFLFMIGLLAGAATIVVSWTPEKIPPLQRLASPWGACLILLAVFGAFGAMTNALSLFEPRAATTQDTDTIKDDTIVIREGMNELNRILSNRFPEAPPILEEIPGLWGEQDNCALVWEIAIIRRGDDAALAAEIIKRPEGVEPFKLIAEISNAERYKLSAVGEEPASARGYAAEFTLNPATQRLTWDDKSSLGGVEEYIRCPKG